MSLFNVTQIATKGVKSLVWHGDQLVDWVGGAARWGLDGSVRERSLMMAYRFDSVVASPDSRWVLVYERLGTKGILLKDGRLHREIDRSYYWAHAYDFPAQLIAGPNGTTLLVHCPRRYNQLEVEDAETGRVLTSSEARKPSDFFHSQLTANPSCTRIASAGWIWHPIQAVVWFDIASALADARELDRGRSMPTSGYADLAQEASAAWLDDTHLVVGASADDEDAETVAEVAAEEPRLKPNGIAIYDVIGAKCTRQIALDQPPGLMMPLGTDHIVAFYRHPRLVSLRTGEVLHSFTNLSTGEQAGSIALGVANGRTPLALDPRNARFAAVDGATINVVQFDLAALSNAIPPT